MSITTFVENFLNRGGNEDESSRTVQRNWRAITNNINDDATTILNHGALPTIHTLHPNDDTLWVTRRVPKPVEDGYHWLVAVEYSRVPGGVVGAPTGHPWDEKPGISFFFVPREKVFEKAYQVDTVGGPNVPIGATTPAGTVIARATPVIPVVNSVKNDFDPPTMITDYLFGIKISRNEKQSEVKPETFKEYANSINKDILDVASVQIAPFEGLMRNIRATKQFTEANEAYWSVEYEIVLDLGTWLRRLVDRGYYTGAVVGVDVEYTQIQDSDGSRVDDPVLLDGAMGRLAAAADLVTLDYHGLWETPWSLLKLPTTH